MNIGDANTAWKIDRDRKKAINAMAPEAYDAMMVAKFPVIFANRRKPMNESCMCWGFCIGPGWQALVHDLCVTLDFLNYRLKVQVVAAQVKEKFGTLRFYTDLTFPEGSTLEDRRQYHNIVSAVIGRAESDAASVCEVCGDYVTPGSWNRGPLCPKHDPRKETA